jgi:hypothetical protein
MTDHYERLIDVQINLNDLKMFNDSLSWTLFLLIVNSYWQVMIFASDKEHLDNFILHCQFVSYDIHDRTPDIESLAWIIFYAQFWMKFKDLY